MATLRRQVANWYVMPESLLSTKHAEAGPCGQTTIYIHNTCQEKLSWVSKEVNNQQKEKTLKSFCLTREKPRGPPKAAQNIKTIQEQA